jgi:hypothetical protein
MDFIACSSCDERWRRGRWYCGQGCVSKLVEGGGGPVVSLIHHLGSLDPAGWHKDENAAHKEMQCLLSIDRTW